MHKCIEMNINLYTNDSNGPEADEYIMASIISKVVNVRIEIRI